MNCYLCDSHKYIEILNKQDVRIWTNADDEQQGAQKSYQCVLRQCENCGHVYQPINDDLRNMLSEIYLSNNAQGSTPMGKGNWGLKRAKDFLDKVDFKNYKSAVEIGCADGYILRCLKKRGFKKLAGIEPSISKTEEIDSILFIKDFADKSLKLSQKYDLIFSNAVFEHIEKINNLIEFCKNNLSENGEIFFSVPNAQGQLENGDPGLFLHQHAHYYTERSLVYLLSRNGFKVNSMTSTKDSLDINAKANNVHTDVPPEIVFYNEYKEKLEKILIKVKTILQNSNVVVHGANNALNNILGWLDEDFDFVLVDNDNTKQGKKYFNKIIKAMTDIELGDFTTVLIVSNSFYETIKAEYIKKGFSGRVEGIMLE